MSAAEGQRLAHKSAPKHERAWGEADGDGKQSDVAYASSTTASAAAATASSGISASSSEQSLPSKQQPDPQFRARKVAKIEALTKLSVSDGPIRPSGRTANSSAMS